MAVAVAVDLNVAKKVLETVDAGLVCGVGKAKPGEMCVEAAVCYAMGLPHGDRPTCVSDAVRGFKIGLNDKAWSSPKARALGLRRIAIAQLGSAGVVNDVEFATKLADRMVRVMIPIALKVLMRIKSHSEFHDQMKAMIPRVEQEGRAVMKDVRALCLKVRDTAWKLRQSADAYAAYAAADAYAYAAAAAADAYAAYADADAYAAYADADAYAAYAYAAYAAAAAKSKAERRAAYDRILCQAADIGIEVLRELKSPGIELMDQLIPQ